MATNDSTAKLQKLIQVANAYFIAMQPFFDFAHSEIALHSNTDFDGLEFLINAAAAKIDDFSLMVGELEREMGNEAISI
jgi:hypothetical protein